MPDVTSERLSDFFRPRNIAMVGATDSFRMSGAAYHNLRLHGFAGQVHLVNPRSPVVHGRRTVPSLAEIDGPVDLAFFVLGGERVVELAEQAGELGIRNLVVLAGGFRETGAEGADRERRLLEVADKYGQVVLGPNTIGFVNTTDGVALYGTRCAEPVRPGPVGVVTQSGMMLSSGIKALGRQDVGFSLMVGVGNEAVISLDKVVDHLVDDPATGVIGLLVESVRDPRALRAAALRALDAGKPIVALNSARTSVTADFAASHTGAIVGDQRIMEAVFEDLGVIRVTSLEDYYATVGYLARNRPMRGRRIAFAGISGGKCELFADRAIELGFEMPSFGPKATEALKALLPPFAAVKNPLDCTGAVKTDTLIAAIDILSRDENVDAVVYDVWTLLVGNPDEEQIAENGRELARALADAPVPVLPVGLTGSDDIPLVPTYFTELGLSPEILGIEHGTFAMERSVWWTECRARPRPVGRDVEVDEAQAAALMDGSLTEARLLDALAAHGVSVVPHFVCRTVDEVRAAAETLGFPLAIKISSPDIAHKSRIGAVVLDVTDIEAAVGAFAAIGRAARAAHPEARIDGALVAPMNRKGLELIVGVKRDPAWGQVLVVGFGGVWVERIGDSVIILLPTTRENIENKLRGLRGAYLFEGGHGLPQTDLTAVAGQVALIADFAMSLGPDLTSLEVNPLWVGESGIEALDALLTSAPGSLGLGSAHPS